MAVSTIDPNGLNVGQFGNRNMVINGSMAVAQRGTSFTASTQVLDRWRLYNSGGTYTLSQQTFAVGTSPETGLINYVRIVRANPSGIFYFASRVEDVRRTDGATLVFSFYAKASSAVTVPCRISQEFGSGGSSSYNPTPQNNNLTTSWKRFTMVFNMPSLSGKTVGTASRFEPVFDIPATTATIEITGVQVEVSPTGEATPFEHRSYGDELQKCMRYYYQIGDGTGFGSAQSGSGGNAYLWAYPFRHPVPMRAAPTLSLISGGSTYFVGGIGVTIGTPTGDLGTVNTSTMAIQSDGKTTVAIHRLGINGFSFTRGMGYGGTSGFIHCDAEL
tara:strand:- start:238 stop:1230 length:993 start_codon:yes stop_codon:yes gene_type:complete